MAHFCLWILTKHKFSGGLSLSSGFSSPPLTSVAITLFGSICFYNVFCPWETNSGTQESVREKKSLQQKKKLTEWYSLCWLAVTSKDASSSTM